MSIFGTGDKTVNAEQKIEGMLCPYRVLDLTNERGFLCGKLLGDLGADVIKIEKPGGDPARSIGPFYKDIPDPERSLYWWAFNTSKRGITLDIETADGKEIFKRLVCTADVILESFDPGYMDNLGLGYSRLSRVNPQISMASITGFGQNGPYRNYNAPDLVVWALSGMMYLYGDPDRAPLAPSFPIGYVFGALQATIGTMIALYHRENTGKGQYIDASAQLSLVWPTEPEPQGLWEQDGIIIRRSGRSWFRGQSGILIPVLYPCKDGSVTFFPFLGPSRMEANIAMGKWMESEGISSSFKDIDYATLDWQNLGQEFIDEWTRDFAKFFMTQTKKQLLEGASRREIILYPVFTPKDMLEFPQLNARGYWVTVEHPELETAVIYPGAFITTSGPSCKVRRAPLIGEHNIEIYINELGLSKDDLMILKQSRVI